MTAPKAHFSLSCDSYQQVIFSGFTRLQEQQEFVDLTLAADGYIVKVHKNIMALASPYIKELLKSTSSDNPVIFLNNVKHDVLKYLLEYIYQGEVLLPQESIESFLKLSQSLHISGMAKPNISKNVCQTDNESQSLSATITQKSLHARPTITIDGTSKDNKSNVAACIKINNDHNFEVQQFDNINISNVVSNFRPNLKNDDLQTVINADTIQAMPVFETFENGLENPGNMEIDVTLSQGDHTNALVGKKTTNIVPTVQILSNSDMDSAEAGLIDLNKPLNLDQEAKDALKIISQYAVTERGSVQIVVSRYLYCCHHSSRGGRKHRWRCADYRKNRCQAYIDSMDGRIISRKGVHNHAYHDDKIYKKHENGTIFNSYKQAKESWTQKKYCSDIESDELINGE